MAFYRLHYYVLMPYVCVRVCVYIYVYVLGYLNVYIYACMNNFVTLPLHECALFCVCVCVCVCVCMCERLSAMCKFNWV